MDIIDKLIKEGWYLSAVDFNHRQKTNYYHIIPPDHRKRWAAQWKQIQYGSLVILIPHWAYVDPHDVKPSSGMPPRFGNRKMFY